MLVVTVLPVVVLSVVPVVVVAGVVVTVVGVVVVPATEHFDIGQRKRRVLFDLQREDTVNQNDNVELTVDQVPEQFLPVRVLV